MEREDKKQLITALVGAGLLLLIFIIAKPQNFIKITDNSSAEKKSLSNGCSTFIICERKDLNCGTFSLVAPIIYIIKDNPVKEYYAILHTFWVSKENFDKMQCYENEESAQAAGYQPSKQAVDGIAAFYKLKNWNYKQ